MLRRRAFMAAWGLAASVGMLIACGGRPGKLDAIPQQLRGYWITDAPQYEDRGFQLDANGVVFYTGDGTFRAERLQSIDTTSQGGGVLYELRYRSAEGPLYYFDFLYRQQPEPTIRFKNQQSIVWKKTDAPPY